MYNTTLKALKGAVDARMDDIQKMVDIRGQLIYQRGCFVTALFFVILILKYI